MVKYKSWVDGVSRLRGETQTRHGLLRLDKNERVTAFHQDFFEQIKFEMTSDHLTAYPEVEALYERLARLHQITTDNLMITAGSDAAIRHCFDLFVNPSGEVVVLDPTFAMVDIYCKLYNARKQGIGYDRKLQLDIERLLTVIGPKTELIVIANPNSPTGTLISETDLDEILLKAARYQVPVLVDEAYYGFCKQTAVSMLKEHSNLIVSRTFSKAYGLAGLRVGYLLAQSEIAQLLYRFRSMYEVNSLGILAAMKLLDRPEIIESYLAETEVGRQHLLKFASENGLPFQDTQTNFIYINFGNRKQAVMDEFSKSGILVRGGLPIEGFENYLRLSLGPVATMQALVEAFQRVTLKSSQSLK
jgi:histidinol-phosphate aminotransferase